MHIANGQRWIIKPTITPMLKLRTHVFVDYIFLWKITRKDKK
jgi:hypothetical protein